MKRLLLVIAAVAMIISGCHKFEEQINQVNNRVDNLEERVLTLEELCKQMNTNISSLQSLVKAVQQNDYVTGVTPITKNGEIIGYTISFTKSDPITIYHGKDGKDGTNGTDGKDGQNGQDGNDGVNGADGKDGHTPIIGVKQDSDGVYYWTVDGEWLLDANGNKIKAVGTDGKDGADGKDGQDGTNGTDGKDGADGSDGNDGATGPQGPQGPQGEQGVTPQLKIENDYWYISYDNGKSWTQLGKATGEQGPQGDKGDKGDVGLIGDSMFTDIDYTNDDYIVFTLSNGTEIRLPTWYAFEQLQKLCNQMNTNISSLQVIVAALQNNDYVQSIVPLMDNGKEVGYTITFTKSGAVNIYHGKDGKDGANGTDGKDGQDGTNGADGVNGTDGKDGHTPIIGVKQHTDGIYYWTIDGEWLLDNDGNKVKAVGTDGKDGANGTDGKDGQDGSNGNDGATGPQGPQGEQGVTPQLKIENGYWYVSYDNGSSWKQLEKATGEDGKDGQDGINGTDGKDGQDGDSFFQSVTEDEYNVYITLADGSVFTLPKTSSYLFNRLQSITFIPKYSDGKATMNYQTKTAEFDFLVSPKSTVKDIAANWQSLLSIKAVYTITRAVSFVDMPIISFEADETNGVITITVSGENLSEEFFTGTQEASAALHISDGNNSIVSAGIQIFSKIDISDLALKKYLVDNYDYDGNGEISIAEAENISMVNCSGKGVANLIGLESCTNLVTLDCSNNNITKIELPNLAQLETITCNDCPIELMNFNGCTSLQYLNLQDATTNAIIGNKLHINKYNQAKSLTIDVSNTNLEHIFVCRSEILAYLDVSKNTQLKHLEVYVNPNLKSIDVSTLVNLEILDLGDCDLTNLDVSKNLMLTELYVTNNKLSTIDVSQNKQLKVLKCKGNQISNLNVSNNDKLETLILEDNKLSAINVSNNTALAYLNINNNAEISIVDVQYNTSLKELYCNGLAIGELNIVNNTALTKLECHTNKNLTTLTCGNAFANATNRVIAADKSLNILNVNGQKVPYRVGDLIKDGSCWGVVFSISSTTKIMSVAETSCNWSSAKTWCSNYGSGWYLPSATELSYIYDQTSTINSTLSAHSFTTLGEKEYWSSTEDKYNYKEARVFGFLSGGSYFVDKSKSYRVRAVLAF